MDPIIRYIIIAVIGVAVIAVIIALVANSKKKKQNASRPAKVEAPKPTESIKKIGRPSQAISNAQTTAPVVEPVIMNDPEPEPEPELDAIPEEADDWGSDIAIADDSDSENDLEEPHDIEDDGLEVEEDDVIIEKDLEDISAGTREAFSKAIAEKEFSISKMREADDLSQKCVRAYLEDNEVSNPRKLQERLFVIHPKIQVSDLPEFAESYIDDGSDQNQRHFSELEEMCETHEESVLELFLRFNSQLPPNMKCTIIGEVRRPIPGVVLLAPEWDDQDFAKPDFGEDEADVSDEEDFYEDYYDDLDEIEEAEGELKD